MGSGIAEACARSGHTVVVRVLDEAHLKAGRARIEDSMGRAVTQGRLDATARDTALERIGLTTDLADLAQADLVIEAVPERLDRKREVFAGLRAVCRPDAILAHQHLLPPGDRAGLGLDSPGAGGRPALLQPGSGHEAGGAG
jgi:3-hydroxybutyryl-CoA dehydrogenase